MGLLLPSYTDVSIVLMTNGHVPACPAAISKASRELYYCGGTFVLMHKLTPLYPTLIHPELQGHCIDNNHFTFPCINAPTIS